MGARGEGFGVVFWGVFVLLLILLGLGLLELLGRAVVDNQLVDVGEVLNYLGR